MRAAGKMTEMKEEVGGGGIVSHRGLSLGGSDHFRVLGFPSVRGLIGDSTALVRTRTNGRRADVV